MSCLVCTEGFRAGDEAVAIQRGELEQDRGGEWVFAPDVFDDGEREKFCHLRCVRGLFSYARARGRCGSCDRAVHREHIGAECPYCGEDPHQVPVINNMECPFCDEELHPLLLCSFRAGTVEKEGEGLRLIKGPDSVFVCADCAEDLIGEGDFTVAEERLGTGAYAE